MGRGSFHLEGGVFHLERGVFDLEVDPKLKEGGVHALIIWRV